jgi:hypothetical protein
MITMGNHFWDKVGIKMGVQADGVLDSPPTWACDTPDVTLTPEADGLTCVATADMEVAMFTITVTAPADIPGTDIVETVGEMFTGSFSHSKATTLTGSFSEVPRP